jgi:hypothetical protein
MDCRRSDNGREKLVVWQTNPFRFIPGLKLIFDSRSPRAMLAREESREVDLDRDDRGIEM